MRRSARFLLLVLTLLGLIAVGAPSASAASYRTLVAQVPTTPAAGQSVVVWVDSDTAFGETAGLEYQISGVYTKVLGAYDTSHAGANWRLTIPAQPQGTTVSYQLFTRNQSGSDYGFTGFNWTYTVAASGLVHDTYSTAYRSPGGAVPVGTPVTLKLAASAGYASAVDLVVYQYVASTDSTLPAATYPMTWDAAAGRWTVTYATPSVPSIAYYKFKITGATGETSWYADSYADDHDNVNQGGTGAQTGSEPQTSFQISVYAANFTTPSWMADAAIYQVFPDRFRNGDATNDYCVAGSTTGCPSFFDGSQPIQAHTTWNEAICDPRGTTCPNAYGNQFFGGDLKGVQDKLDYLKSLGFNTIYLTPIFQASSNHRYDTSDYLTVDPALGGNAAYSSLISAANAKGMRIILDGVFNHTSSDSVYFDRYHHWSTDGACESTASSYRPWYEWNDSVTPCTSASYNGWFGYDSLAVLKDDNSAARDFIYRANSSVMKTWYAAGTSGWRFDVADEISHDWWHDLRPYAKAGKSTGPLVGEVWYDASKYLLGDQLDAVMNYRFRKNILGFARGVGFKDNDNNGSNEIVGLTPSSFDAALASVREDYPKAATNAMMNLVDSHDTNRALYELTLLGDTGLTQAKERLKLTSLFQFAYMGAPTVYYGDEAAINAPSLANGTNGPEDDPYNRAPYPWADASGATSVYGPADASMISWYTKLAAIRKAHPSLRGAGTFTTMLLGDTTASATDNSSYAFARTGGGETTLVLMNNGASSNTVAVPAPAAFANGKVLIDGITGATTTVSGGVVTWTLPARSGAILYLKPATVAPVAAFTTTATARGAAGSTDRSTEVWSPTPVTLTPSATDDRGIAWTELTVDGKTVRSTKADRSVTISAQGIHRVSFRAMDTSGTLSATATMTVRIDTAAPVASGTVTGTGATRTIALSATDARSGVSGISYRIGSGPMVGYSAPFTVPAGSRVTYAALDLAGNAAPESVLTAR